jgi:hypothetical protein
MEKLTAILDCKGSGSENTSSFTRPMFRNRRAPRGKAGIVHSSSSGSTGHLVEIRGGHVHEGPAIETVALHEHNCPGGKIDSRCHCGCGKSPPGTQTIIFRSAGAIPEAGRQM